ncbi:acetyl-CoA acyltransferase [Deltaproteobacteria bacterium]|nr:acetyl-CoA acyltransferase [Deltaproteobacteria bacterium]
MGIAYLVDAVRTPLARVSKGQSALSGVRPDQLAAHTLKALVARVGIDPALVEDVVMGNVTPVGEQGLNIGRNAALVAGFPVSVTGTTVNRMCGSSQQAVNFAAMGCASGFQDLVIAGGVEMMSRVPMGSDMFLNGNMAAPAPEMSWRYTIVPQGISAELVAQRYGLSRAELDAYSFESHRRAAAAQDAGAFDAEITAVSGVSRDDGIRRGSSPADLAKLKPAFKEDGVVTAASSSQITDGAAAMLIASERAVREYGLKPRARIVAMATAGCDPTIMLTAPVPATRRALAQAGLSIGDIDAVEINEAFASVALGCGRDLGFDFAKTNVHGGAIALGHPLGASGARLFATLLGVLERSGGQLGLTTMCIGFGQGITTIIDREV